MKIAIIIALIIGLIFYRYFCKKLRQAHDAEDKAFENRTCKTDRYKHRINKLLKK